MARLDERGRADFRPRAFDGQEPGALGQVQLVQREARLRLAAVAARRFERTAGGRFDGEGHVMRRALVFVCCRSPPPGGGRLRVRARPRARRARSRRRARRRARCCCARPRSPPTGCAVAETRRRAQGRGRDAPPRSPTGVGGWVEPAARGLVAAARAEAARGGGGLPRGDRGRAPTRGSGSSSPICWRRASDRAGRPGRVRASGGALAPDYPAALVALGDLQREAGGFRRRLQLLQPRGRRRRQADLGAARPRRGAALHGRPRRHRGRSRAGDLDRRARLRPLPGADGPRLTSPPTSASCRRGSIAPSARWRCGRSSAAPTWPRPPPTRPARVLLETAADPDGGRGLVRTRRRDRRQLVDRRRRSARSGGCASCTAWRAPRRRGARPSGPTSSPRRRRR